MEYVIKIILVEFMIITVALLIVVFAIMYYVPQYTNHIVFGQQFPQDQFNNPQNQQFGQQQQFSDPNQQFGQQGQFGMQQQPYQSGGFGMQQQYPSYGNNMGMGINGYPQQGQQYGGFGIQQIIAMIVSAGAGAGGGKYAADRRTKALEELHRETMEAELKTKQQVADLARVTYTLNQDKIGTIEGTAPSVKLDNLTNDVDQFREKTAKA